MEVKLVEKGFVRDCFISWGRLEFFHLGGQGKHLGLNTFLVCFSSQPPAGPSPTFSWWSHGWPNLPDGTCSHLAFGLYNSSRWKRSRRVTPKAPMWFLMVRGARSDKLHCDMSDKTRLLPAVQTPGNNSPAAVRKAFSWGGVGAPGRTIPWSVTPPCSIPSSQSSPGAWKVRVGLAPTRGTAPATGPHKCFDCTFPFLNKKN